jgi:RNA polymerase-binding protein DksA
LTTQVKNRFGRIEKLDKAFLKKMKEYLLEQRKTLLASLADQGEDMRNLIKTVESGDEADVAADVIDRTLLNALGAQDANRLQQIDNALDRINQGTYGRCVKCGKEIPQERLEVLPYALMCVNCASAQERKNR